MVLPGRRQPECLDGVQQACNRRPLCQQEDYENCSIAEVSVHDHLPRDCLLRAGSRGGHAHLNQRAG